MTKTIHCSASVGGNKQKLHYKRHKISEINEFKSVHVPMSAAGGDAQVTTGPTSNTRSSMKIRSHRRDWQHGDAITA